MRKFRILFCETQEVSLLHNSSVLAIAALPAEHRLAPPRHPQTNGMVERFNGRINELLQQTRFDSRADLQATLLNYLKLYNHQRAIGSKTPVFSLKEWQQK